MMYSAVKATSAPVHFHLLDNFLSAGFKSDVAKMSEALDFEVSFVSYKWPDWLRKQEEKQRVIWGYKILFLDVLFPVDMHKVIYIDADQVVRGDLRELWETDLKSKVYGFVPFCSSRKDMLGYQFWREGYWKDTLQGRPYHISALFVVDLDLFRQQSAGDQLRGYYDALSRDPNSLANLDQDLPNSLQQYLPIHSLPQEWLWCETWCSEATKKNAKTIDLCNNPELKEEKIRSAKRIISGDLFEEDWETMEKNVQAVIA
jgi:UDP-glucose:glycoprotein glucosyltransferase